MFYNSIEVVHTSLQQALHELFMQFSGLTFCAHNATFDARMLVAACQQCGIDIASKGITFCNTLPMFKDAFVGQKSYCQEYLVQNIIGKDYSAHNALSDVSALMELHEKVQSRIRENAKYYFTVESVKDSIVSNCNKKKYISDYKFLIEDTTLSEYMASKLTKAGISVDNLQHIANEKGVDGLDALLRSFTQKKLAQAIYLKLVKE